MNIRNYTQQERICASSRLSLPYKVNSSMDTWNQLANNCNARVTFIPGVERPIGPLGNWMQTITITVEGDYDNPKCKELFDSLQANSSERLKKLYHGDFSNVKESDNGENSEKDSNVEIKNQTTTQRRAIAVTSSNANALLKRAFLFLEDGDWSSADEYCETVLDMNPECAEAYLGKLMADLRVHDIKSIANHNSPIQDNNNFQKALRFGNDKIKAALMQCSKKIMEHIENERCEDIYQKACVEMDISTTEEGQRTAAKMFASISTYKDAKEKRKLCLERVTLYQEESARKEEKARIEAEEAKRKAESRQKLIKRSVVISVSIVGIIIGLVSLWTSFIVPNNKYDEAIALMESGMYVEAIDAFESLAGYKNVDKLLTECRYENATLLMKDGKLEDAFTLFEIVNGYKDSSDKLAECQTKISYLEQCKESSHYYFQQDITDVYIKNNYSKPNITATYESVDINGNSFVIKGKYVWKFIDGKYANCGFTITGEFGDETVRNDYDTVYYTDD